jgi:hypothetical protein
LLIILQWTVALFSRREEVTMAGEGRQLAMKGEGDVVTGWNNKLRAAIANLMPSGALAEMHRREAGPGTAKEGAAREPSHPQRR